MIKKLILALMLVVFLSQFAVPVAFAAEPVGSCPTGFMLETAKDHDVHHHLHAGVDTDFNGDGYICMNHVTPVDKVHVHIDNSLPKQL